jgi:hypothetical protein
MGSKKIIIFVLFLIILILFTGCDTPVSYGQYQLEIIGAIDRSLYGSSGLIYEHDKGRDEISIFQQGLNQEPQNFVLVLPPNLTTGTYQISPNGPVSAGYITYSDNTSRLFTDNDNGNATFVIEDNKLSVSFILTLDDKSGSGHQVQISGRIWDLPYQDIGGAIRPPDPTAMAASSDEITPAGTGLICFFGLLLVGNFIFQFSVGAKIYAHQGSVFMRSLRGTRTFFLGWMEPKIRHTMILWTILLAALLLLLVAMYFIARSYT